MKPLIAVGVASVLALGAAAVAAMGTFGHAAPLPTAHQQPELVAPKELGFIAGSVALTMTTAHYSGAAIDDSRSRQWLDRYIRALDPQRVYLLASDVAEFQEKWATTLDDDVLSPAPTLEAAFQIHGRFRQRVAERVAAAQRILAGEVRLDDPKATVDLDRSEDPWAADTAALDAIWRTRITEQVLTMKLGEDRGGDPLDRLRKRYERVQREAFDVDAEDVLEVYITALTETFDPHSNWFKPVSKENFDIDMQDTLIGIGAVLNMEDGYVVIRELVKGGPAEQSGLLKAKDTILAVAQGPDAAPTDVVEMRLDRVVQLIRGKEGSPVVLTVHPGDAADPAETKQITLVREKVKLSQSAAKGEVRDVGGLKLGVIDVPSFYVDSEGERAGDPNFGSTARDVAKLLTQWNGEGVQAVLLDLRENGGGSLDQALQLSGLFLKGGPVVQIRDRQGEIEVLKDPDPAEVWTKPVIVLTSEFSASASEIFAAALQDHGRALVVGSDTTHGKGTVQNLMGLERFLTRMGHPEAALHAGAIKFTTHMFYRVNGASTQLKGVSADIRIPSPFQALEVRESDLDFALPWDEIAPARYKAGHLAVDVVALQSQSAARVSANREFTWMLEDVAENRRMDELDALTLDLDARKAEVDETKQRADAREAARKASGWDGEAEIDPVLDEAVQILADLLRAGGR